MGTQRETSSRILVRGLAILDLLAQDPAGFSASEIAERMSLHRSSVYRYLHALSEAGYTERTGSGQYVLGSRLLELANLSLQRIDLRTLAHSHLVELCSRTDGTVHLCRLDDADVVYLDKVETSRSLPLYSRIGGRAPAYCTGVGKVLMAHLHAKQLDHVIRRSNLHSFTDATITDPKALRSMLSEIVQQGHAYDRGEHEEGVYCVAVPIFDLAGEAVASISVTDLRRKIEGNEPFYLRHAKHAALQISRALGHQDGGTVTP